jgi:hypothetical protein
MSEPATNQAVVFPKTVANEGAPCPTPKRRKAISPKIAFPPRPRNWGACAQRVAEGSYEQPLAKPGFWRGFREDWSGAYCLYVSTGPQRKRSQKPGSAGVATCRAEANG